MTRGGQSVLDDLDTDPSSACEDELEDNLFFSGDESELPPGFGDVEFSGSQVPQQLHSNMHFRLGAVFEGTQTSSRAGAPPGEPPDVWAVSVRVQEIDLERGRCSGDMSASDCPPKAKNSISTHWEGEIIDGITHSFLSTKWKATLLVDLNHWSKFSAFQPLAKMVLLRHGRCNSLHEYPYIFMRWKEQFFMNNGKEQCNNLSISGFYYIVLCRKTGKIEGYYYDPKSRPFQKLDLKPAAPQGCYSSYSWC